jgi:hypothetical protein
MPGFISICSGFALSSTVFVTAAHCFDPVADPANPVLVSFKSGPPLSLATDFTPGTFHPHPGWCPGCGPGPAGADFHDVAVVELHAPVTLGAFAQLPSPFAVDALPMKTPVDLVGYGRRDSSAAGKPIEVFRYALFAPSQLAQSNDVQSGEFIAHGQPGTRKGRVCLVIRAVQTS